LSWDATEWDSALWDGAIWGVTTYLCLDRAFFDFSRFDRTRFNVYKPEFDSMLAKMQNMDPTKVPTLARIIRELERKQF